MGALSLLELFVFAGAAAVSALLALIIAFRFDRPPDSASTSPFPSTKSLVLLYEDTVLSDLSETAQAHFEALGFAEVEWSDVQKYLRQSFPSLGGLASPRDLDDSSSRLSFDGRSTLNVQHIGNKTRIVIDKEAQEKPADIDNQSLRALEAELETLRSNSEALPFLVWRETSGGDISWINRAYFEFVETHVGHAAARQWPPFRIFESRGFLVDGNQFATGRLVARAETGDGGAWYECRARRINNETVYSAVDARPAVKAEEQLREFTQTLAKTFSHLTVGLAVFDKNRRLRLFNPALSDLTGLQGDFLAARPTFLGFLDELREAQMIPEPKDYQSWRARLAEVESEASAGTYQETWTLPTGQTYRVSGRPHPDGSVAFVFEDISAQISLTRRFRAELELGQAVVDSIDDAIAVFSSNGTLTMRNRAYSELWAVPEDEEVEPTTVESETRRWHELTAPSPVWGDFREFCLSPTGRATWDADVSMLDGRSIACHFLPVPGGATMARFQIVANRISGVKEDQGRRSA